MESVSGRTPVVENRRIKGDYYAFGDGKLNLARMECDTIQRAFKRHPTKDVAFIANELGITERTLYNKFKDYNLSLKILRDQDEAASAHAKNQLI